MEGTNFHSILGSAACRGLGLLEIKDSDAINPIGHLQKNVHVHATSWQTADQTTTEESIKQQYPQVFCERVGHLADHYIRIDPTVVSVQHALRHVLVALRDRLHTELLQLQEPQHYHSCDRANWGGYPQWLSCQKRWQTSCV